MRSRFAMHLAAGSFLTVVSFTVATAFGQQPGNVVPAPGQPAPTAVAPTSQPTPPPPPKLEGPMRVELMGLMDQRVFFVEPAPERAPKPSLRFLLKLTGEKLGDVYRVGRAVIEEFSDETGAKLFDMSTIPEKDKTSTSALNVAGALQAGYHMLDVNALPAARTSKKIATAKGYVTLVFGGPTEEITIENPLLYIGKTIDHPKLAAAGVKVRVLKMGGEEATEPNDGRGIALVFEPGDEQIKSVDFYDDNMKKIATRPRDAKSEKVESYKFYALAGAMVNADTQLVLTVFSKIEKQKVEFNLKDIALP